MFDVDFLVYSDEDAKSKNWSSNELSEKLKRLCYQVEGAGSRYITCLFYDDSEEDMATILNSCVFESITIRQHRYNRTTARSSSFLIDNDKIQIELSKLSWIDEPQNAYIKVVFEVVD